MKFIHRHMLAVMVTVFSFTCLPVAKASSPSSVWLSYSEDEENSNDTYLDLFLGVSEDDTLLFSIGQSQSEFLGQEVISHQYSIGYETLQTAPSSLRVVYEYWGKRREFETHTMAFGYGYHAESVSLGVNMEYREINLYSRTFDFGQLKLDMHSMGYGPEFYVYSGKLTGFINGMWYDYSEDVTRLVSLKALFLLGRTSYNRTSVMNDWEVLTGLQYDFADLAITVRYGQSRSAIDRSIAASYSVKLRLNIDANWIVELEGGEVDEESTDPVAFGVFTIGLRF